VPDRHESLAFRAAGHHLDRRLPEGEASAAVGAVGIRDVQGSGVLAVHARVEDVTPGGLSALRADGTLLEVISARGTDTLVPARDLAVFTLGTLPAGEESLRSRLGPFLPVLDRSGHTAVSALEAAKQVAREALSDGPLDIGGLSGALTAGLPTLSPMCRGRCRVEHIDQGLFDLVGGSGLWRKERHDGVSVYIAMKEPTDADGTRRQLVRRYLHCYGPSTPAHFAAWCGISTADAARSLASPDTVEVDGHRFVLTDDIERSHRLRRQPASAYCRHVTPTSSTETARRWCPDREWQRKIWRATPTEAWS